MKKSNKYSYLLRIKPGFDKWNLVISEDIEEGEELTLKYKLYDPRKD